MRSTLALALMIALAVPAAFAAPVLAEHAPLPEPSETPRAEAAGTLGAADPVRLELHRDVARLYAPATGEVAAHEFAVFWHKVPDVPLQYVVWAVTIEGETLDGARLHLEGTWSAGFYDGVCTQSIPSTCFLDGVGPLALEGTFDGAEVRLAGVAWDVVCTQGHTALDVHIACNEEWPGP